MRWHKLIRVQKDGVSLAADVNAAISINQNEPGATNEVKSASHVRVVQDSRHAARQSSAADESKPRTGQEEDQ